MRDHEPDNLEMDTKRALDLGYGVQYGRFKADYPHTMDEPIIREEGMGEKLRAAREAAGMTQTQLAEKVNVQQRDISKWENGHREPGVLIVKKMAQALGCSMDELI